MFASLSDRISDSFKSLRKKGRLTENDVESAISDIRRALLEADVALPVVRNFIGQVRERGLGALVTQGINPAQEMVRIVNEELIAILGGQARDIQISGNPAVIMLAGLQGAGKTTLAGKLAKWLAAQGKHPVLVACDLQRPNAVNQLEIMAQRAGVGIYAPEPGNGVGDPIRVASASLGYARENRYDVVIIDTAGRLGVDEELMDQARRIRAVTNPQEVLFVLDAMIGQDAVQTSLAFKNGVGFTGVVLSKLDGDARGGAALSVRGVTGVPVLFASTGEKLEDFERFHPDRMASRILDMGDVLTLIEQAQKVIDEKEAEAVAGKLAAGKFTLNDFLSQLEQLQKLGPLKKMMGMLPGMNQMRGALDNFDEKEVTRVKAIVQSMTPAERENPKIINGQRRSRIARGSGVTVSQVNEMLKRFDQAATMMQQLAIMGPKGFGAGGPMGAMGLGSMPGGGKKSKGRMQSTGKKNSKKNKKGRSGNPAKRAKQELEAQKTQNQTTVGSAFGGFANGEDQAGAFNPENLRDWADSMGAGESSGEAPEVDFSELSRFLR